MSQQAGRAPLRLVAFADETRYNKGRYRGIALVSLRENEADGFKTEVRKLITDSNVKELKWQQLDGARERFAAAKALRFALEKAAQARMRADILIWDTRDRRHIVRRRDDIANLQRMYYHLFRYVLCNRWPDGSVWNLFPDENTSLDWGSVEDFLEMASTDVVIERNLLTKGSLKVRLRQEFRIEEITPCKSIDELLVQLADLLAGLGAYSRERFETYEEWQRQNNPQQVLFSSPGNPTVRLSRSDRERCQLLAEFDSECKRRKLGVSLQTNRGLFTYEPKNPINFWPYVPQHDKDKAPVKSSK